MTEHNDDKTHTHVILKPDMMINHYRLIEKIGAGGMGEVFLAEDSKLQRKVALKFLPAQLMDNTEIRTRFVREAQTVAKLNHPNIVSIYEVSEFNGRPYYAMEHVEGANLHHFAHEKQLSIEIIIEYALQLCQGLGEAHRAGIIHRDIKAANIAVDKKERIKILDFGLAAREGDDKITKTGSTLGTVSYMSPEQVSGRDIDHRSDLFSLGIVLYELIAGRSPFKRDNEGATLKAIMEDSPEPLTRYKSDVPEKLQDVILKLLEKDKEIRYQSAEGVMADLKRLMYDSQQTGHVRTSTTKAKKRSLLIPITSIAAIVLIAMFAIWKFMPNEQASIVVEDRIPMIAVLPFENLGSADDEYFADGITDEITSRLAGITGLGVISRTSAMKYKNTEKSLKEIGAELGVNYVVDGTVRWSKTGENPLVRITPQLVRVSDDRPLWSDNYEHELLEVFSVQADIATKIVNQLDITLVQKDKDDLNRRPTENSEAYEHYIKALALNSHGGAISIEDDKKMYAAIDSAVTLDPDFALAHALRSRIYSRKVLDGDTAYVRIAKKSAEKALELSPGLPQGHIALGNFYNFAEEEYELALDEFNKAKSEMHNDAELFTSIGMVKWRQGYFEEAAENLGKAAELDPLDPYRHNDLGYCLTYSRSYEEALMVTNRAIALKPEEVEFWAAKITLFTTWKGKGEVLKDIANEALKHCDSVQFLSQIFWLKDYFPEINWKDIFNKYRMTYNDAGINYPGRPSADQHYIEMIMMSNELEDTTTALLYADSAKSVLEERLKVATDDFHRTSALGAVYSVLGDCDKAIEYGRKGIGMMPTEECHW